MPPTYHVLPEADPCYIPCMIINLSNEDILLDKHTIIASLGPYQEFNLETKISHILEELKTMRNCPLLLRMQIYLLLHRGGLS